MAGRWTFAPLKRRSTDVGKHRLIESFYNFAMLHRTCHSGLTHWVSAYTGYLERDVNWRNSGSVDALFLPDRLTSKTFSETTVVELTE